MRITEARQLDELEFRESDGLVPVVAQHALTGETLMLAYANRAALARTLDTGEMWYFSRTRRELWHKGETSGNTQRLVSLHSDCDSDALLARVEPAGPACHTGARSCFGVTAAPTIAGLAAVIDRRAAEHAETSYTARLRNDRNLRLKKLGEEAAELVLACADSDRERAASEAADLIYHALVACAAAGARPDSILAELERRLPDQ